MTKFDEAVVRSFVNWTLRALDAVGVGGAQVQLACGDCSRVLVDVPQRVGPTQAFAAELNRGFGAWDAKYRAAPDEGRRVTVRALP